MQKNKLVFFGLFSALLFGLSSSAWAVQANKKEEPKRYLSSDPTRPYYAAARGGSGGEGAEQASLILLGVWHRDGKKFAFINEGFYQEGETLLGWQVARIDKHKVMLRQGSKRRELNIFTHADFKMEMVE